MEDFDFPNHTLRIKYPELPSMKFGRGYSFGVKPLLPVKRQFLLSFNTMRWITLNDGISFDNATDPDNNMKRLLEFYDTHLNWKRFSYTNSLIGTVVCTFGQPLETPKSLKGGTGWTEPFELVLQEQAA